MVRCLRLVAGSGWIMVAAAAAAPDDVAPPAPMNHGNYKIANALDPQGHDAKMHFRGEYFELLGPLDEGHYGEVHWRPEETPLPPEIVKRFDGKVMAVTGYEVDIVRPGPDGSLTSVPCTQHYNHHYTAFMSGKAASRLEEDEVRARSISDLGGADGYLPMDGHGTTLPQWDITAPQGRMEPLPAEAQALCNVTGEWINGANEISVDMSQISPTKFSASCVGSVGWKDAAGTNTPAVPGHPQGGVKLSGSATDTGYFSTSPAQGAPPCSMLSFTSKNIWFRKPYQAKAPVVVEGIPHIQAFSEGNGNEHRVSLKASPRGFAQLIHSPTTWNANAMIINTNKEITDDTSPGPIGGPLPRNSLAPEDASYQGILECPCTTRIAKVLKGYKTSGAANCPESVKVETYPECEAAAQSAGLTPAKVEVISDATSPPGCSATSTVEGWSVRFNNASYTTGQCSSKRKGVAGSSRPRAVGVSDESISAVTLGLDVDAAKGTATIVLTGNSSVWYGVGFGAKSMADLPYTIVVDGKGEVTERKLANHQPGSELLSQLKVLSNHVVDGRRTVTMTRPIKGAHYTFDATIEALDFISAVGNSPTFSYHHARTSGVLTLVQAGSSGLCLCRDPSSNSGTIAGVAFNPGVCAPYPRSELISTHNPICNISEYGGGLYCCHDRVVLLDADQPLNNKTDVYQMKYRFYFEDYENQTNVFRTWWSTEATNNEYDVPKSSADCLDPATPVEKCIHEIKSEFQARDILSKGNGCMVGGDPNACGDIARIEQDHGQFRLMYAAFHCHAPACISGELWNRDTGELICRNTAMYGTSTQNEPMNEEAYVIGIPPCLWGDEAEGLQPPPVFSLDTNLTSIKRANSTNGHWGVMALWQMRSAYMPSTGHPH